MAILALVFLAIAIACGAFVFRGTETTFGIALNAGFILGMLGFVTCLVVFVARWALDAIQQGRESNKRE